MPIKKLGVASLTIIRVSRDAGPDPREMTYERFAAGLVLALEVYAALGLAFAVVFVSFGVQKIDPEAKGTKLGFRLLIIPGVMAFWPMLLRRWASGVIACSAVVDPQRSRGIAFTLCSVNRPSTCPARATGRSPCLR